MCAAALLELEIIGMLETGGDLVAMEAKYHKPCLSQLYNRYRKATNEQDPEKDDMVLCENIAFAELVLFIENKLSTNIQYIFDMGNISNKYHARIADLNKVNKQEITKEHTGRLREKLLNYFPSLTADKWGTKYVLKSRSTNLMPLITREDQDDDAIAFLRYAKSIRRTISSSTVAFEGTFSENCEQESIPGPLLAAVSTLLYGCHQLPPDHVDATSPVNTICQLIMLNYHEKVPTGNIVRHKKHREPPLPLYMALSCYGRSRDKSLIDIMHQKGISISSNRVFEVTSQLCRLVVQRAKEENVVCPSNLKKNIFTITALDNIDFKATSNTSSDEFHGTGISVFQTPTVENPGVCREFLTSFKDVSRGGDRSVPNMPDFYSNVPECTLPNEKPPVPHHNEAVGIKEMLSAGEINYETYLK